VQATHVYPTLKDAALAVLRIYQPLRTREVMSRLKVWKREGLLGCGCDVGDVPVALDQLQEEERIEYAVGTWRTRCTASR
jgi:hypothetical protein